MSLRLDVVSIFPRMVEACTTDGIVQRAVDKALVKISVHDLRAYTDDRHRTVDDAPFGGGPGMVMKAEPFLRATEALSDKSIPPGRRAVVLFTPRGRRFDQEKARRFAELEQIVMLCGRYEGIDERVVQALQPEEISLGDFVLTGGEVAAVAVIEATVRLLPGALGDEQSALQDSFEGGVLDHPHYTRPAQVRGLGVPEVLLSGDHDRIRRWRRRESLRLTRERRPDLMATAPLGPGDGALLREIDGEQNTRTDRPAGVPDDYEVKVS